MAPSQRSTWADTVIAGFSLALILLLPLLELAAANQGQGLSGSVVVNHFGWMLAYAAFVFVAMRLMLFRLPTWRILIALVPVTFVFFAYGELNSLLRVDTLVQSADQSDQAALRVALLVGWSCALAFVFWLGLTCLRTSRAVRGVLLVVTLLVLLPASRLVAVGPNERASALKNGVASSPRASAAQMLPNIYWLVADGYPRADVLREDFNFDNTEFQRSLERLGFLIQSDVSANYPVTFFSVASMADMSYIVDQTTPRESVRDVRRFTRMVGGDNELVRHLRRLGYRYVHFASGYEQTTLCSGIEDLCILGSKDAIDEIGLVLLRRTPLLDFGLTVLPVGVKVSSLMPFSWRGFDALEDHLAEIRRLRKPFLLYAHIIDPHPPLRHNADCSIRPSGPDLMQWSAAQRPAFVSEVECTNLQLGRVLRQIVQSDPSSIVIVNGDHGSAFRQQFSKSPDAWSAADVKERFSPLLAVRVPVRCSYAAARLTTLVNVFRVVRNCLTGEKVPLLADRRFITPYNDSPEFGTVVLIPSPGAH